MRTKCAECDCAHHFAFRRTQQGQWLCDTCWGYKYADPSEPCVKCDQACYTEEDYDEKHDRYICEHCRRAEEQKEIDQSIDADMDHQRHGV